MGIFTRFRDIVHSNINSMLEKAEDPEKLLKLMIREMEDTLVELKASCAGVIAETKMIERSLLEAQSKEAHWEEKAAFAVSRGRDDLAKQALVEKRHHTRLFQSLESSLMDHKEMISKYQDDIRLLEDKLAKAREKQRMLVQREIRVRQAVRAKNEIRRMENYETVAKFDELEKRIDRMEAELDLSDFTQNPSLNDVFDKLKTEDEIEKELIALKLRNKTEDKETDRP